MKKTTLSLIMMILLLFTSCSKTTPTDSSTSSVPTTPPATEDVQRPESTESASEDTRETDSKENAAFSYVHDPRLNPEAMKDIVENADAVYGFSPDPQSTRLGEYAKYDWSDPALVEKARKERIDYHNSLKSMRDILVKMKEEGASTEEIARAVSTERNRLRLAVYEDDPEALAEVKKSNLETYGHEDGPTPDELYEKCGSWDTVIQKAFRANLGMDVWCGLYDEDYPLYIELGYVESLFHIQRVTEIN